MDNGQFCLLNTTFIGWGLMIILNFPLKPTFKFCLFHFSFFFSLMWRIPTLFKASPFLLPLVERGNQKVITNYEIVVSRGEQLV